MPGLILFNRRWMMGSDDLVVPFGIAVFVRTIWFCVVCTVFGLHAFTDYGVEFNQTCKHFGIHIYFIGYLVVLFISCFNDATVAFISSRGTILDDSKRKKVSGYLYFRAVLLICEFGAAVVGCYFVFYKNRELNCFSRDMWLVKSIVIFNFVWVLGCLVIIMLAYDSAGRLWYKLENMTRYGSTEMLQYKEQINATYEKDWRKTFRLLFCCTKTEISKDNVLLFASKHFAQYFQSYNDLVPSDILAGLILLRQKQKYEENLRVSEELKDSNASYQQVTKHKGYTTVRRHQKTANSIPFDLNDKNEAVILNDVTYFAKYALANYGWPMYCFDHNIPLCTRPGCRLLSRIRCCNKCRSTPQHYPTITGDNCCLCNFASQKAYLDINNDNFIYVSYSSEIFQPPFYVVVDNYREAIVISCRGTLSLQDVMTDLAIDEERIPNGDPEWTSHTGFLSAASKIKEIIDEKQLIEQARHFDVSKGSQNYRIVLVGHSLGAGTASLLAFLMKREYPSLICYAYGPSGTAVSYEASVYAQDFIYSVVLGKDIIGRLNLNTMHELQHNILELLKKTHLPKWKILRGCMCNCYLCGSNTSQRSHEEYFENVTDAIDFIPFNAINERKLFMAGKIVHICKIKSIYPRFGRKKAEYKAFWSTAEDFQNILISNLMLQDHFPDALIKALNSLLPEDIDTIVNNEEDSGSATICVNSPASGVHDEIFGCIGGADQDIADPQCVDNLLSDSPPHSHR